MEAKVLEPKTGKTRDYLVKIGEIVVLLNHLEQVIEFFTWELINASGNAQEIGRRITTPLDYVEKVDLMRSAIVGRFGEEKAKEFLPVYRELIACGEIRNDIAHSQWFIEYGNKKEGVLPHTKKINWKKAYKRGKNFNFSEAIKDIKLDELNSYSRKISKAISLVSESALKLLKPSR